MKMKNFNEELNKKISSVNEILNELLPISTDYNKEVVDAMRYSVLCGGKRIRPILMLETYKLCGGTDYNLIKPFMAAMEYIHTYSLIHDDLPAMDDDDYRRGKKTTHIVYGEAVAILAGDALLNHAFELLFHQILQIDCNVRAAQAAYILSRKAGIHGMIGGQTADILNTGKKIDADTLDFIYSQKTGALIEASMMIGAVLAGSDNKTLELIEAAAVEIGKAFQIRDDILDVIGNVEEIGKPLYSDEKNMKTTYVTIHGVEKSGNEVCSLSASAVNKISDLNCENDFIINLIHYLTARNR